VKTYPFFGLGFLGSLARHALVIRATRTARSTPLLFCISARSTTVSTRRGAGCSKPSTRAAGGIASLFPVERAVPGHAKGFGVQVRLDAMELHRPRQWGACWLACQLYDELQLDRFSARLRGAARQHRRLHHVARLLRKIEAQYGKANRVWVMDRGIPSEAVLAEMRAADPPVSYLIGTPRGGCPSWRSTSSRCPGRPCARGWT
jgi:hypothetical protein